jgi:hypothetical protein
VLILPCGVNEVIIVALMLMIHVKINVKRDYLYKSNRFLKFSPKKD